jgi:hypothetical protein
LPAAVWGFLWLLLLPSVHAVVITPVEPQGPMVAFQTPAAAAFPVYKPGRLPHHHFRGLLDVHSRYGLHLRGAAYTALCIEGFDEFVTSFAASIATG